jgi:hypothetical protein
MSIEQEDEFLVQWEAKATTGGVLTVPPIHAALVDRLGHDCPISTTYRLLARHGWRLPEKRGPTSDALDISGRGPFWENERSPIVLGACSS